MLTTTLMGGTCRVKGFYKKRIEILMDDNLDRRSKYNLLGYFKSKVEGRCEGTLT